MRRLLTRRRLMLAGGAVLVTGGASVGGSVLFCRFRSDQSAQAALDNLLAVLDAPFDPLAVGTAALTSAGPETLWRDFLRRDELHAIAALDCAQTRRADLAACSRAAFARGDSVLLGRWVVSRDEALLAGLAVATLPAGGAAG